MILHKRKWMAALLAGANALTATWATDVVEVLPLTDQIVMVHLDDGNVRHHGLGESRRSDQLISTPMDAERAMDITNYLLTSTNDHRYRKGMHPAEIGRKSKGTDFTMTTMWDSNWRDKAWAQEHWLYLKMPQKLKSGGQYTLHLDGIAQNLQQCSFTLDWQNMRSEAIHVNQIGYLPKARKKYGYVYHWMGDKGGLELNAYKGNTFRIIDCETGMCVFRGKIAFRASATNRETYQKDDTPWGNFLGAEVYECDFSALKREGRYRLAVEGIGCSFPFTVGTDIYRPVFRTTTRGLYHNRSGIELTREYTEHTRPAPHNPLLTPGFAGHIRYTTIRSCDTMNDGGDAETIRALMESGDKGPLDTWGWYQDAGDWDGYPSHLRIPALLMLAYEMFPCKFSDNDLGIPGKDNGIPDILDEGRWLIEYLHRTRHAIMQTGNGTGGVSSRVCGDYWGDDMNDANTTNGSWGDMRTWYVMGEDPMSTYMYAGLAAEYAYLMKIMDKTCPTSIDWAKEAQEAYDWAVGHTQEGDDSAPYAQISLHDAQAYAAASLFKLTGQQAFHATLAQTLAHITAETILGEDERMAVYSYLLLPAERRNCHLSATLKSAVAHTAYENVHKAANLRGCRWGGNLWMPMLVGQGTTPLVLDAIADFRINGEEKSADDVATTMDYFLGNNPLNMIWFTAEKKDLNRTDRRHVKGVFHMDSWYNTRHEDCEVPGYAPYGPWRQQKKLAPEHGENQGWWCNEWGCLSAYPTMQDDPLPMTDSPTSWPGHERWFSQRYAPPCCENTVHQNTVRWAIASGFMCSDVVPYPFRFDRLKWEE